MNHNSMNDLPRKRLSEIICDYGKSVCHDPKRVKGLLLDLCGDHRREISALTIAHSEGFVSKLLSAGNVTPELTILNLAKQLQQCVPIDDAAALWAIESWALALNIIEQPIVRRKSPTGGADFEIVSPGSRKSLPEEVTNSIGMKLKLIPAGEFLMGSPVNEADRFDDEGPQHKVRITKPFYMGVTEVTQGQWFSVMGTKPWSGKEYVEDGADYPAIAAALAAHLLRKKEYVEDGADYPAVYVGWEDVIAYCKKLSTTENKSYRLPTEAEWEYACRGGTTTAYSFGSSTESLKAYAWFYDKYAHHVGTKKANLFGLHDMHGNVWEWCSDWYGSNYYGSSPASDPPGATTGSFRVLRGGCWYLSAGLCRSAFRRRFCPSVRDFYLGFRLALSPSGQ